MAYHIGIITIDDSENYGNRLQNLAMQSFLTDLGYEVTTFHRNYSALGKLSPKRYLKIILGKSIWISKRIFYKAYAFQKFYKFYGFNKHYITWDKHSLEDIFGTSYLESEYDALVVGSDQVWNFQFDFNDSENLLHNISPKIKKISVAASVGNTHLTEVERILFHKYLDTFDAVSVREHSSISLLQPYYHRNIIQLCDPTLLMGRTYWEKLEKDSRLKVSKPYILFFFLGPISHKIQTFSMRLAEILQLHIVQLNDIRDSYYGTGPIDFLRIVRNAEYILTDSFHCSVFSILFQKKFSVYNRDADDMDVSNRTDELLELFELQYVKNLFSLEKLIDLQPPDDLTIDKILENERKRAETFVKEGLG